MHLDYKSIPTFVHILGSAPASINALKESVQLFFVAKNTGVSPAYTKP